jgi:hypothetical protein
MERRQLRYFVAVTEGLYLGPRLPALSADRTEGSGAMHKYRGGNRWELVSCGLEGHVTFAPDEEALADRLSGTTTLGQVWRCLRCGEFVLGEPHRHASTEDAPTILRGKALRQATIIRTLGAERVVRAVLIGRPWR